MDVRLRDDAFQGLGNKAKRDRVILDLIEHPQLMDQLNPSVLIAADELLEIEAIDVICIHDVAAVIHLSRGEVDKALDLTRFNKKLADLINQPVYSVFARMLEEAIATDDPYGRIRNIFISTAMTISFHADEAQVVPN